MYLDNHCKIKPFYWYLKGVLFAVAFLATSCTSTKRPKQADLPKIMLDYVSFETLFFGDLDTPLAEIKKEYPYFFPAQTPDSIWTAKRTDSLQQVLFNASKSISKEALAFRVEGVLRHAKFYFPSEKLPKKVISLLTDVDYSLRAVDADSLLLLSIDTYLGADHPLYEGIPKYIKNKLTLHHLESEIIDALAHRFVPAPRGRTFLAQMVNHGKRLLLHQYLAPELSDQQHIQYTALQHEWALENESVVWRYFVDNELLFSTDEDLTFRFLLPSPYAKFYSYLDEGSPGRIGQWIGYQIVKKYQERTGTSLSHVLLVDPQEILKKSKYNP